MTRIVIATPPSPPFGDIDRQAAGGMGLWKPSSRPTVGHWEYTQYDLSLLWTAGVLLNKGYDACFIDGQAERLDESAFADRIGKTSPEFIVGMVQFISLVSDLSLLARAKRESPGSKLIIVGSVTRMLVKEILTSSPEVDFVVTSEPELATCELISALLHGENVEAIPGIAWRKDETIEQSPSRPPTDLASLPPTPYHLLAPYPYYDAFYFRPDKVGLVATTRGCPFGCQYYCPYPAAYGRKVRFRKPEVVVEEIEFLHREFGVRSFYFRDQVFTVSEKHAREVCQRLIAAKLNIRWICETRFDLLKSDELIADMRDAGCMQIHFGLETGDPEMFKFIGKPGTNLDVAKTTLKRVEDQGIQAHFHMIVGLPGESWSTIKNTAKFVREAGVMKINLNRCIPYPGTELYKEADRNGWIRSFDWARYGSEFVMRTKDLSIRELELARKYLVLKLRGDRENYKLGRRDRLIRPVLNFLVEKIF